MFDLAWEQSVLTMGLNLLITYTYFRLVCVLFDRTQVNRTLEFLCFLGYYLSITIANVIQCAPLVHMAITVVFGWMLTGLYAGSLSSRIVRIVGMFGVLVLVENVVYYLTLALGVPQACSFVVGTVLCAMVNVLLSLVLQKMDTLHRVSRRDVAHWMALLLLPLSSTAVAVGAILTLPRISVGLMLTITMVLLMINVLSFYLFDVLEIYHVAAYEMKQQNLAYQAECASMHQSEQQVRILRHDMQNHLTVLRQYAVEGQIEKLEQYLDTFAARLERPGYVHTGNLNVDSILNYKLEKAHAMGAELDLDIQIPEHVEADLFDLNVILSNLLDNAIEAMERTQERRLALSLRVDRGIFYLKVVNSYDGQAYPEKGQTGVVYRSRKQGEMHGIGLESVKRAVEHYRGQLEIDRENREFTVKAMLYLA